MLIEPSGVGIFLNGSWLANNSIVTFGDIGEDNCALLCYTNLSQCCNISNSGFRVGEWYFPNKTTVKTKGEDNKDFYRNRGTRVVRLNRRNNAMTPTGIFCCVIPGSSHGNFCVGAYNVGDGKTKIQKAMLTLLCMIFGCQISKLISLWMGMDLHLHALQTQAFLLIALSC